MALRRALNVALADGVIDRNVVASVKAPRAAPTDTSAKWLTVDEARALVAAAGEDERWGDPVIVALATGLRRGELLGLAWSAIDLDARTAQVRQMVVRGEGIVATTKSGQRRSIPLSAPAVAALQRTRKRQAADRLAAGPAWTATGLVFTDPLGAPLRPDHYNKALARLARRAIGRPIGTHALRHAAASLMALSGAPVKAVQTLLGHSTPGLTLSVYTHLVGNQEAEAVANLAALLDPATIHEGG
jgi:integrase